MHINSVLALAITALVTLSAAQPHRKHLHVRHQKRALVTATVTEWVDQFGNRVYPAGATPAPVSKPALDAEFVPMANSDKVAAEKKPTQGPKKSEPESKPEKSADTSNLNNAGKLKAILSGSGLDREFPDGKLSCSHFPSDYGAIATSWITKQGWSGIQLMEKQAAGDIRLANGDGVGECREGYWCSYACPAGYSKAQWPESEQPANGESIGGLRCENGKLWLTRPHKSKKLCIAGADSTTIVNNLQKSVAICRTDYPGT